MQINLEEILFKILSPSSKIKEEVALDFLQHCEFIQSSTKRNLAKAGDFTEFEYFILSGCLRSYYTLEGSEYNCGLFAGPGVLTPWHIRTENSISVLGVQTIGECELVRIHHQNFADLREKYSDLRKFGEKVVFEELMRMRKHEQMLLSMSAKERYIEFLNINPGIEQLINQGHIANYLNLNPVSLSRIRAEL